MKWVKCVYNGSFDDNELTIGKIYKVYNHFPDDISERVEIIKDDGVSFDFYVIDTDGVWFEDADAEVRDNKINQIGI